jgi:hypothetical protein
MVDLGERMLLYFVSVSFSLPAEAKGGSDSARVARASSTGSTDCSCEF